MYWLVRKDEQLVSDVFEYLDELNGVCGVNIIDATLHVEIFFNLQPQESRSLVTSWLENLRNNNGEVQDAKQSAIDLC